MTKPTFSEAYAKALSDSSIIQIQTGSYFDTGRIIRVRTDQGWNPEPYWQEIEDGPPMGGSNDTSGD